MLSANELDILFFPGLFREYRTLYFDLKRGEDKKVVDDCDTARSRRTCVRFNTYLHESRKS